MLKSQIAALTEDLNQPKRPRLDDRRLARLQSSLQEGVNTILDRDSLLAESAEESFNLQICQSESFISRYGQIAIQTGSIGSLALSISEREAKHSNLAHERASTAKRTEQRKLAEASLSQCVVHFEEQLADRDEVCRALSSSVARLADASVGAHLRDEKRRLAQLTLLLSQVLDEQRLEMAKADASICSGKAQIEALAADAARLDREVVALQAEAEQRAIETGISMNKNVALRNQLVKSVKEKVAEIVRARSDSMDVMDLIERQQHNWIERQSLIERCNDVAEDHNYKTKLIGLSSVKSLWTV
jgi:hypothetical protein